MRDTENVRQRLVARAEKLTEEALKIDAELREVDSPDWDDRATDSEGDEVLERLGVAAVNEIKEIRAAIRRIAAGTYGTCTTCRRPIGEQRLEAVPYTAKCINCANL
ncbi:MAG: TraR/DksA family transcriptional regulator [Rhodospirillales bacterium]|nr:TraR/DksA family transcriptional regulator [Rhodospirillales bacterium]